MPLLKFNSLGNGQAWAIWQITETEEDLSRQAMERCPDDIVNSNKRLEWIAARALVKTLMEQMGYEYRGLGKDEFGKPLLQKDPRHISLSHSYPFVMSQIDNIHDVGVDLEQPKEKLRIVASRVFHPAEVSDAANDLVKLCIYWCAKEALYKIHGKKNLLFADHLRVEPFTLSTGGYLLGRILFNEKETIVHLQYLVEREYVIVYTAP
jgi:4'-phosphopantetheinyl transferase